MHTVCKDKPAILNYVLLNFDFIIKKMSSDYPGLYPDSKDPVVEGLERERILYEAEKASRELIAHREAHKNDIPSGPPMSTQDYDEMLEDESQEESEESRMPLYEPHILAKWARSLMDRLAARPKVQIVEFSSERRAAPVYAPKISAFDSGWRGLIGAKQNTQVLLRNGLNNVDSARLMEHNLTMIDFRTMKYAPVQMRSLFTTLDNLRAAGFTGQHLDACCWRLGDFAIAYSIDPVALSQQLNLGARRLLEVGVAPSMLHQYGLTLESALTEGPLLDFAYMSNFSCAELAKALHTHPEQLFASVPQDINKLTQRQVMLLCYAVDGWKIADLARAGLDDPAIRRAGLGLRIKP